MSFSTRDLSVISGYPFSASDISEAYRLLSPDIRIIGDRVFINASWGQIAIDQNPFAEAEYGPDIVELIYNTFRSPSFYILRYTNLRAAAEAILHWPKPDEAWIDNDLGRIEPLSLAIRAINAGINWVDAAP